MWVLAATPQVSPEVKALLDQATSKLEATDRLLTALTIGVGVLVGVATLLAVAVAVAGFFGWSSLVGSVEKTVKATSEEVARGLYSKAIARLYNSASVLEWAREANAPIGGAGVIELAERALEFVPPDDLDAVMLVKNSLAYYYVYFEMKEKWDTALRYSAEAREQSSRTRVEPRKAVEWLDTYAYVRANTLSCAEIEQTQLAQLIEQWMERYESIKEPLQESLNTIRRRCQEAQAERTS